MVTSMIPSVSNVFVNKSIVDMRFLSPYSPLINYDWNTTTTSGLRYLKDVGSTPTYNASMYFGRGVYFNGVDQYVDYGTLSTSSASVSMVFTGKSIIGCHRYNFWTTILGFSYYRSNGVTIDNVDIAWNSTKTYTITISTSVIKVYENGIMISSTIPVSLLTGGSSYIGRRFSSFAASIVKDVFMFNRVLTQTEIIQSYEQPELFYAMAQADSTCVLNMPMCETDGYVRNMKSYSEGSNLILNSTFDTNALNWTGLSATILSVNGQIEVTGTATVPGNQVARSNLISIEVGKKYLLECDITQLSSGYTGFILSGFTFDINGLGYYYPHAIKKYYLVITATATLGHIRLHSGTAVGDTARFDNVYVKELNGIHSINNYTTSVRDNAKNLQYGLQTCKFVRDSSGVIQSASTYLECNGTGYAIIPSHTDKVNIKMTVNPTSLSGNLLSGGVTKTLTGLTLNVDNDVVISNVTPTGAITLASGFTGTIKSYKEELV